MLYTQVKGKKLNGSHPQNLPQGYYFEASDVPSEAEISTSQPPSPGTQSSADAIIHWQAVNLPDC